MLSTAEVIIAGSVLFAAFVVLYPGYYLYRRLVEAKKISPLQASHRKKEDALLKELLKDINENTDNWFLVHDSFELGGNFLVNDRKNIGLMYKNNSSIVIHLNLKSMVNFTASDPDTVALHISGKHVIKFLTIAEYIIDKRGNELSFFKDKLHKQL